MVRVLRRQALSLVQAVGSMLGCAVLWLGVVTHLPAAPPNVHFEHAGLMPPGAIGGQRLSRGGPLPGYFQPVEIKAPPGAMISTATQAGFGDPEPTTVKVGFTIGAVYRLRITEIPGREGIEVFPTIEVIDRLYPPLGKEAHFPIPIEITEEELALAIEGKFVTRVIYLEDPDSALPVVEGQHQEYFEAKPGDNPLDVADGLGRPMAILRLGGRVPDAEGPDAAFLYGSPMLFKFNASTEIVNEGGLRLERSHSAIERRAIVPLPMRMASP